MDYFYGPELYHHGIKGQKWGVRRFQNKDGSLTAEGRRRFGTYGLGKVKDKTIREEHRKKWKEYSNKHPLTKEMNRIEREAYSLADKYDLDYDDGGGGDGSEAARRAQGKYLDLWEEHDRLEDQRDTEVGKKVSEYLINKYGEDRVNGERRRSNAKAAALVASMLALPFVITAATSNRGLGSRKNYSTITRISRMI